MLGMIAAGGASAWLTLTIMGSLRAGAYWRAHPEVTFTAIYATVSSDRCGRGHRRAARAGGQNFVPLSGSLPGLGGALALVAPGAIILFLFPPAIGASRDRRSGGGTLPLNASAGTPATLLSCTLSWGRCSRRWSNYSARGRCGRLRRSRRPRSGARPWSRLHAAIAGSSRRALLLGSGAIALVGWGRRGDSAGLFAGSPAALHDRACDEFPLRTKLLVGCNDGARPPPAYSRWGKWRRGKRDFSERLRWFAGAPSAPGVGLARHRTARSPKVSEASGG